MPKKKPRACERRVVPLDPLRHRERRRPGDRVGREQEPALAAEHERVPRVRVLVEVDAGRRRTCA